MTTKRKTLQRRKDKTEEKNAPLKKGNLGKKIEKKRNQQSKRHEFEGEEEVPRGGKKEKEKGGKKGEKVRKKEEKQNERGASKIRGKNLGEKYGVEGGTKKEEKSP